MAYSFCGFIGQKAPLDILARRFLNARIIGLPKGLFVIPLVDELIQEINGSKSFEAVDGFEYLSKKVEALAVSISQEGLMAYAEIFLSAGIGDQAAVFWAKSKQTRIIRNQDVINSVLRQLGAVANKGQDEFLAMGFGLRRFTDDRLKG
jgi:hypothetical protein